MSENKKQQILFFFPYMVEQTWNMVGPDCTMWIIEKKKIWFAIYIAPEGKDVVLKSRFAE